MQKLLRYLIFVVVCEAYPYFLVKRKIESFLKNLKGFKRK